MFLLNIAKNKITYMCKTDFLYSFNTSMIKMLQIFPTNPNAHMKTESASFTLVKPGKLLYYVIKAGKNFIKKIMIL